MARATIKSTYSLDLNAASNLERLAADWGVSKSEALRRAIDAAARSPAAVAAGRPVSQLTPLEALDALQASTRPKRDELRKWEREIYRERKAASARHEWRRH